MYVIRLQLQQICWHNAKMSSCTSWASLLFLFYIPPSTLLSPFFACQALKFKHNIYSKIIKTQHLLMVRLTGVPREQLFSIKTIKIWFCYCCWVMSIAWKLCCCSCIWLDRSWKHASHCLVVGQLRAGFFYLRQPPVPFSSVQVPFFQINTCWLFRQIINCINCASSYLSFFFPFPLSDSSFSHFFTISHSFHCLFHHFFCCFLFVFCLFIFATQF